MGGRGNPIIKKLKLVLFALGLVVFISGSAPRVLNTKSLLLVRSSFPLPVSAEAPPLSSGNLDSVMLAGVSQVCVIQTEDYCIVEGNFIFEQPLDPAFADPFSESYKYGMTDKGRRHAHRGVDFSAAVGTPVVAAADGEVVFADFEKNRDHSPWVNYYGNFVVIRHANNLFTLYGHLSKIIVETNQEVHVGEVIGRVGRSGAAVGPHLHFEVRRGAKGKDFYSTENPELWLKLIDDENNSLYGALSVTFDADLVHKVQRNLVVEYYLTGTDSPTRIIHTSTYPAGFENNSEDAVLSKLQPGRYRIVVSDNAGIRERWAYVESGRLTQVYMVPK